MAFAVLSEIRTSIMTMTTTDAFLYQIEGARQGRWNRLAREEEDDVSIVGDKEEEEEKVRDSFL